MRKFMLLFLIHVSILVHSQNVGIGITNPVFKLDVRSGSINTDSLYRINGFQILSIKGNQNLFVGRDAGISNTGMLNSFSGHNAGLTNTSGSSNSFFGSSAGRMNTTGGINSFFGDGAGFANTMASFNSFFGSNSGGSNTTGELNAFIGAFAGSENIDGNQNTYLGAYAGFDNQSAWNNTMLGYSAGNHSTGWHNTMVGSFAGHNNITGDENVALGYASLFMNTNRSGLVAVGDSALHSNGIGASTELHANANTALGSKALSANTIGYYNTATGREALRSNTTGYFNTATGKGALKENISGNSNSAIGTSALELTTGDWNTALGAFAASNNGSGNSNTAIGRIALRLNASGSNNTAIGMGALYSNGTGSFNNALGHLADVGSGALTNATAIGSNAFVTASNSLILGSISGINGATATSSVGIGVTDPAAILHVSSPSQEAGIFNGTTGFGGMYIRLHENGIYRGYLGSFSGNTEDIDIGTGSGNTTGKMHLAIQGIPKLTVAANGNVGINTINPDAGSKLHVITDGINAGYMTSSNGTNNASVLRLETTGSNDFVTNGITIDIDNLQGRGRGINVLSGYIGGEFNSTDITGASENYGLIARTNSSNNAWAVFASTQGALGGTKIGVYANATGGLTNWAFYGVGNAFLSGGTWQTSDERFKRNVTDVVNASEQLKLLVPKSYYFNRETYGFMNLPEEKQFGFLAGDIEKIFPFLVKEVEQFREEPLPGQENQKIKFKAVNYTGMIPLLIQAINEHSAEFEKLKNENEELRLMMKNQQIQNVEIQKQLDQIKKAIGIQ